jgi:hypothetical protein
MDSYGLIMRADQVLSPGASLLLNHLRQVACTIYPERAKLVTPVLAASDSKTT